MQSNHASGSCCSLFRVYTIFVTSQFALIHLNGTRDTNTVVGAVGKIMREISRSHVIYRSFITYFQFFLFLIFVDSLRLLQVFLLLLCSADFSHCSCVYIVVCCMYSIRLIMKLQFGFVFLFLFFFSCFVHLYWCM